MNKKIGKINISSLNYPPERHEYETAKYFSRLGFDIIFIKPSSVKGSNNPDFKMKNKSWETKSPTKYSKSSFEYNFKKAQRQSDHIIFDLRRLDKKSEIRYLNKLSKWRNARKTKTIIAIKKDGKLIDIKGKF